MTQGEPDAAAAALAATVLEAGADRPSASAAGAAAVDDAELVGVGAAPMTLREGIAIGGAFTFVVLLLLAAAEGLENAALTVLAPDIATSFKVSDGTIVFVASASSAFLVLGALPMGWLADRYQRTRIAGLSAMVFAAMVFVSGITVNAFTLFLARLGAGIGKSSTIPVHGSIMADTYPIGVRGRLSGATMGTGQAVAAVSPALVGLIAHVAGGTSGWRWVFFLLGLPTVAVALLAFRIKEPQRGRPEMLAVLGEVVPDDDGGHQPAPISLEAAFARLKQVRTLRTVFAAFAALGFGLFTRPIIAGLYLKDRFGLDSLERGLLTSVGAAAVIVVLPFAASRYDGMFREDPAKALRFVGMLIAPVAVVIPVQYAMPNAALFTAVGVAADVCMLTAFTMVGPIMQSVMPYRLRGMGTALGSLYLFFVGATGGALLSALLIDATGPRPAVIMIMVPASIVGGLLLVRGSMLIRNDLADVRRELEEEKAEHERRTAAVDDVPLLHVHGVDFAYGPIQVLFDVGFEVQRGEVFALLGTNGAGKSTILRVIAGLGTPGRGVVRFEGEPITFVAPEQRGRLGIRLLPGGKGVFPSLSVRENLEVAAFVYRGDPHDHEQRIARVLALFPELEERLHQKAGSLSGGQQQMLALAGTLLHDPQLLLIDELSLGLAPIVVQRLLAVVEQLKREGKTVVIVEQSINVALALADRAVFLEKGRVRFMGPARDLLERGDLVRAVFLGDEGG